ncbi:MAG: riboflavin synthase, partial [Thermoguttaceae bacterium]|nr:riboflavin synthase [Thermoguttaceae bacterium]
MFSGIVEALGEVAAIIPEPPGCKIVVRDAAIAPQVDVADSVAVNGCCLTVIEKEGDTFAFQAGP